MSAIFISHSTKDRAYTEAVAERLRTEGHRSYFIDYDEESGIAAGTEWEQVLYKRLRQCQAVVALVTPNWLASKWCFAEMVQAREKGKPIFAIKWEPCELPGLLSGIQSIDLTLDLESGYRRLIEGLRQQGLDPANIFLPDPERPPYPGFPAFEEADAAVFYGRTDEILRVREILEGLRRHNQDVPRLVLILGSSGSGKSSLVRAGLIPRLKKDNTNWLPLRPFRPQDARSPLDALAFAIEDTYQELCLTCDCDLRTRLRTAAESTSSEGGELLKIAQELAVAANRRDATVLITLDQAEELLSAESYGNAKIFLQFLGASLSGSNPHLMAVATLRSDSLGIFQNQVASLDALYRLGLAHRPVTLEPVPIEHYKELIEEPALLTGLELERNLVLKLLQDAGQSDSLPLLAFTLRRLYDLHSERRRTNHRAAITLQDYEDLGGLLGAVPNAAEDIFRERQPTNSEINAFREACIPGLVRYNENRSYSRRRVLRQELPVEARSLLEGFVDARILVADVDKDSHPTIEIAHEALLRTWPTLVAWLAKDRDKLRLHSSFAQAAKDWDESGQRSDLLLHRDGRLKDAAELVCERRFAFPPGSIEQSYLDACVTEQRAREAAAQEERERRVRDAESLAREKALLAQTEKERAAAAERATAAEKQRAEQAEKAAREQKESANKLRRLAIAATVAAAAAVILLVITTVMWGAANEQRQLADKNAKEKELAQAKALSVANDLVGEKDAERKAATQALSRSHFIRACRYLDDNQFQNGLAYLVAACRADRENKLAATRLFALLTQCNWLLPVTPPMPHLDSENNPQTIENLCFSDNGALLLSTTNSSGGDGVARVWNASNGSLLAKIGPCNSVGFSVERVCLPDSRSFSRQGDRLLLPYETQVVIWDVAQSKPVTQPLKQTTKVTAAEFLPDGMTILVGTEDGSIAIYRDISKSPRVLSAGGKVEAFSRDGQLVLARSGTTSGMRLLKCVGDWASLRLVSNLRPADDLIAVDQSLKLLVGVSPRENSNESSEWKLFACNPQGTRPAEEFAMAEGEVVHAISLAPNLRRFSVLGRTWNSTLGKSLALLRTWERGSRLGENWQNDSVDVGTHDPTPIYAEDAFYAYDVRFSSDSLRVASLGMDGSVRVWDATAIETGPLYLPLRTADDLCAVAFSPDGKLLATGSYDGMVRIWDLHLTAFPSEVQTIATGAKNVAITSNSSAAIVIRADGSRNAFDLETAHPVSLSEDAMRNAFQVESESAETRPRTELLSPDGSRRLVPNRDGVDTQLVDVATGQTLADNLRGDATFSPSGHLLALTQDLSEIGQGYLMDLIDAHSGKRLRETIHLRKKARFVCFSEDESKVVTGDVDVIDIATGERLTERIQLNGTVGARLSNQQLHVCTFVDGRVQLWHVDFEVNLAPEALLAIGTAVAEKRLNEDGFLEYRPTTLEQLHTAASSLSTDVVGPVTKWAKWFLENPETRPARPGGTTSLDQWIDSLIADGSESALHQAELFAFGNAQILEKIESRRNRAR